MQSFNGVVRPLGEARPAWKIFRVLGNVLNLSGFDYESAEAVRDELLGQGTEFAAGLDNGISGVNVALAPAPAGLQRVGDVPIHFADTLVRRAPSLLRTRDGQAPVARIDGATAAQLGLEEGAQVRVRQGDGAATLTLKLDEGTPAGCVRVPAAHAATAALGDLFGTITVERA